MATNADIVNHIYNPHINLRVGKAGFSIRWRVVKQLTTTI